MVAFAQNPQASAQMLRRIAARNLGLDQQIVHGTVDEYRELSRDDQVRLTDEMASLIVQYPEGWPDQVIDGATDRVENPMYRQPLEDESFYASLDVVPGAMFQGAKDYVIVVGFIALLIVGVLKS